MVVHYIPIATSVIALYFFVILFRHWNRNRKPHVFWWMLGVFFFGAGTVSESVHTLGGFSELNFKLWYIFGALLGGAPLAQGTVYLLMKKRTARRLTVVLVCFIMVSITLVAFSPLREPPADGRLTGKLLQWTFIRYLTPFINLYAFIFLVGGAIYSAIRYSRDIRFKKKFAGNVLIALGGLLPGIGGSFTRFGYVEVLYVTEFMGIILIYLGYDIIRHDKSLSIHAAQVTEHTPVKPVPAQ